jgi:outer membrane beta-barrel protein
MLHKVHVEVAAWLRGATNRSRGRSGGSRARSRVASRALCALLVFGGFGVVTSASPTRALAQCIDDEVQDELNARRTYRGVQKRLFQKAGRHEISLMGGLYAADLFSSSWVASGAYSFHITESLGLEASVGYTRTRSEIVDIIEQDRGVELFNNDAATWLYQGHVLWSLAYGKLRWFGSGISRFDFYVSLGGGITDNQTASGLTASIGPGIKFYVGEWFAIRMDLRNHILQQELLGESTIVQNLMATMGASMFLPFGF